MKLDRLSTGEKVILLRSILDRIHLELIESSTMNGGAIFGQEMKRRVGDIPFQAGDNDTAGRRTPFGILR